MLNVLKDLKSGALPTSAVPGFLLYLARQAAVPGLLVVAVLVVFFVLK